MTELEKHLLIAFEQLQTQHKKQHADFVTAYENLVIMFNDTSSENATLRQQVQSLSGQTLNLSRQVNDLSNQLQRDSRP